MDSFYFYEYDVMYVLELKSLMYFTCRNSVDIIQYG